MPLLLVGAALLKTSPLHLIIHSPSRDHPGLLRLLEVARRRYLPQMIVMVIADEAARAYFSPRSFTIENLPADVSEPTAYFCEDYVCQRPVTKPEELRALIDKLA
jgi:uncharacterized protein YyaL (SSP411 family)